MDTLGAMQKNEMQVRYPSFHCHGSAIEVAKLQEVAPLVVVARESLACTAKVPIGNIAALLTSNGIR